MRPNELDQNASVAFPGIMEPDAAARQEAGCLAQPQKDPPNAPDDRQPSCCSSRLWRRNHQLLRGGTVQPSDQPPHLLRIFHSAGVLGLRPLQSWAQQPHLYCQSLRHSKGKRRSESITVWQLCWFDSNTLQDNSVLIYFPRTTQLFAGAFANWNLNSRAHLPKAHQSKLWSGDTLMSIISDTEEWE